MKKLAVAVVLLAGCGGGEEETLTVYLKQRLGPEGPHSQIAPVLMPVERERRDGIPAEHQAVLEVRVGPSPDERAHGFLDTLKPETRLRSVTIAGGTANVELLGREPDFYGTGAIVYSLTAIPGVERVALRLEGKPCCAYRHDGSVIRFLTRSKYRGWQGEPCKERDRPDAARCRG
jgi:sporulation and spore germination protein